MKTIMYYRFSERHTKKQYIYQFVRGQGDMATYTQGKIIGKKTNFEADGMAIQAPIGALKNMVHRGLKCEEFEKLEDLEAVLFLENFLEVDPEDIDDSIF